MLIPNKKSLSSVAVLASYDEKTSTTGSTYVPVVSLEYSLPGPISGNRLPPANALGTQIPSRIRLPRQYNRRSVHVRNNLADDCTDAAHQIQGVGIHRQEHLKPINFFSSSTPTVPFSSSELLYGGDVSGGRQVQGGSDDVSAGDVGTWGGDKSGRLKELDVSNRRPTSRNSSSRKVPNIDKVAFDRDREELRPIANSLPPSKQNPLRANGIKNNLLRADQYVNQRNNAAGSGREEDLVAMGTLWSPSQLQTRGSSTATTTTSSSKSMSAANSVGGTSGVPYPSSTLPSRRPINLSTTTSTRQLLHNATAFSSNTSGMGNIVKGTKEVEPKYSDPLVGAPPTFQQRLMELATLEAETVRWERTKKVKKKPKQDRDS